MRPAAIICLGNRYLAHDDVGPRVFDHLSSMACPAELEVIDGGLCGLDLLRLIEGRRRVVFADTLAGLAQTGEIVRLSSEQIAHYAGPYGHAAGLPYLIKLLPQVCSVPLPAVDLLGTPCQPQDSTIGALAQQCLEVACDGLY
ncbi:MAG: hydrogenase maturation protease [Rhodoferax sp.]|nr:hydrogenase maturation protease [Rhodoferax sp.]